MIRVCLVICLFWSGIHQAFALDIDSLIQRCVPTSHWKLMKRIVQVESNNNPLAIHVNNKNIRFSKPRSLHQAKILVRKLVANGISVDIGLTQINSWHFRRGSFFAKKGLKAEDALDPCINLKMSAYIISEAYRNNQHDLARALSVYNTGNPKKGFSNGYIDKFLTENP